MINRSVLVAGLVAVAAGAWILSGQFGDRNRPAKANGADQEQTIEQPRQVRVRLLEAAPWRREVIVRGRTGASRSVEVRAETAGRIAAVPVEQGRHVDPKTLIARIAPAERTAALEEAEALLRQREVEFKAARALASKGFRSDTKLAEAAAQLDAARARVVQIRTDIARTSITAPFDGFLETRHVELGDYVKIGDPIARVVDLDPLLFIGAVSEREIVGLERGLEATMELVDGKTAKGTVRFVGKVADPATRTFRIEIEVPNPDGVLRDGITSQIRVPLAAQPAHFLSPALLTLDGEGRLGVKTVDDGNRVVFHPVTLLAEQTDGVWIDGLPRLARVISVGHEFVRAGQKVTPVAEVGEPAS